MALEQNSKKNSIEPTRFTFCLFKSQSSSSSSFSTTSSSSGVCSFNSCCGGDNNFFSWLPRFCPPPPPGVVAGCPPDYHPCNNNARMNPPEEEEKVAPGLTPTVVLHRNHNPGSSAHTSLSRASLHSHLLLESQHNVYQKYEVVQILGQGSMGVVAKVRIRPLYLASAAKAGHSHAATKHWWQRLFHLHRGGDGGGPPPQLHDGHHHHHQHRQSSSTTTGEKSPHDQLQPQPHVFYALKSIQLDRISDIFLEELNNEIDILRSLDHPNIVKLHEVYHPAGRGQKAQIFLVLELCDGGDLYTRSPYTERDAAHITTHLLSAIRYMHDHGIVHRDLKYENVMWSSPRPDADVKIIDFGLSKKFLMGVPGTMTERVGTIYTMAPQVLQGVYSSQADLWSLGVMTYMMLSSSKPFHHKRSRKLLDLIMRGAYSFDLPIWEVISDRAKDFVNHLLVVDPAQRFTAAQALQHDWIVHREQWPDELPSADFIEAVDDSLVRYRQTSYLKKLALMVIAHRSTQKEVLNLKKAFESMDTEKDGTLSFEEFREALKKGQYSDEVLNEIFQSIDVNQNGKINYTEFLAATIEAQGHIQEDKIAEAFERLDSDDTGFISKKNLRNFLGDGCAPETIEAILKSADVNRDGRISWDEFLSAFREQRHEVARLATLVEPESSHESEKGLLGLDARIPGGKYDTSSGVV